MPVGRQDHGRVVVTVAIALGDLDQPADLNVRQVLARPEFSIRRTLGRLTVRLTTVGVTSLRYVLAMTSAPIKSGLFGK